jgi:shikimate dehydrogenase
MGVTSPSATTRLLCVLGHPVAHSISPQIHNAALAAAGIDAAYLAFDVQTERLAAAVAGLRALGFLGANVTVPHKRAVWDVVDGHSREAEAVGAANTLFWDGDRLVADNTDAAGLQTVLERDIGLRAGDPVVVFGTGGAARAAAVALGRLAAQVEVVGRRPDAVLDVASLARRQGAAVAEHLERPRLVVNATPLGLRGEVLPDRFMRLDPGQIALDLVYGRVPTPFLVAARERGAQAVDGLGMLVAQAVLSFERWTGQPAPLEAMQGAAHAAILR